MTSDSGSGNMAWAKKNSQLRRRLLPPLRSSQTWLRSVLLYYYVIVRVKMCDDGSPCFMCSSQYFVGTRSAVLAGGCFGWHLTKKPHRQKNGRHPTSPRSYSGTVETYSNIVSTKSLFSSLKS